MCVLGVGRLCTGEGLDKSNAMFAGGVEGLQIRLQKFCFDDKGTGKA